MKLFRRKWFWITLLLLVIGGYVAYRINRSSSPTYVTEEARRRNIVMTISANGELVANRSADLSFRQGGKISVVEVKVGDVVKRGQTLAQIDASSLYSELRQAEADIEAQKETYQNFLHNQKQYNRDQWQAQKAVIARSEAARDEVLNRIQETIIRAPFDGLVTKRFFDYGEVVTAANPVFSVVDMSGFHLEALVPESDITDLSVGQIAEVQFDALPSDDVLTAMITKIDPASTVIQGVVYFAVELDLEKADERLKSGMSADVDIHIAERKNVIAIPNRAVKDENGNLYVEVLVDREEMTVERKNVVIGLEGDDGSVEIVSGLNGGEEIVIAENRS